MTAPLQPCVFFDRDGIANVSPSREQYYVLHPDQFHIVPAFIEAVRVATVRGYAAVVVTNQSGIKKGLLTAEVLEAMHDRLRAALAGEGLALRGIYWCPHGLPHPDYKPTPGMLLRAAREHGLDLARSWMVGDQERDLAAGRSAGCVTTVFVGEHPPPNADWQVPTMEALPDFLQQKLTPVNGRS